MPQSLEPGACRAGVPRGMRRVPVSEVVLNQAGIVALVGQVVPATVSQHLGCDLERQTGADAGTLQKVVHGLPGQRSAAFGQEQPGHVQRSGLQIASKSTQLVALDGLLGRDAALGAPYPDARRIQAEIRDLRRARLRDSHPMPIHHQGVPPRQHGHILEEAHCADEVFMSKRKKFFSPERWVNTSTHRAHELALNPAHFGNHAVIEVFQTLVHEQCHLWQYEHGNPSRGGYHNREWAEHMESIGLIPSSTGQPGGKKTGQRMSDYPAPDGKFLKACESLVDQGFKLPWVDRFTAGRKSCQPRAPSNSWEHTVPAPVQAVLAQPLADLMPDLVPAAITQPTTAAKRKLRYQCPSCGMNVWGKPGLNIGCLDCDIALEADDPD